MVNDEERRAVAQKLRNAVKCRKNDLLDDPGYSPFTAFDVFLSMFGRFPHYLDLLHLADLIDCATCEDVSVPRGDRFTPYAEFKCSACGCSHVSLTYVRYCPNCGAEVRR